MKQGIHPTYHADAVVVCGTCGNTFHTGSTRKEIHLDICSNCHPFYTGEQRIVDTAGQVERFMKRAAAKDQLAKPVESKKARRRAARTPKTDEAEAETTVATPVATRAEATTTNE